MGSVCHGIFRNLRLTSECFVGYIMDRRVGNTKKMGALFGILAAIGGPIPEPETIPYAFFILSNRLSDIISSTLSLENLISSLLACEFVHPKYVYIMHDYLYLSCSLAGCAF